ncbi:MAG: acetyl-CoA carboxylase biotin carboxylase subunit family protein [Agathobacter sp.]
MFKGKKLLILGATTGEVSLVKRAQSFGVYVIVTDNNTDYTLSPAKYVADEVWDVSWSDIDTLEKLCQENRVNGVTAGYSEFRIENLIKLCERLKLPCYATMEQLEITRDKIKFKNECRKNNVPVVKEYASVDEVEQFPVIVKPVDRAGSIGISVANNKEELQKAYEYAMEMSVKKQVIIEQFIYLADKMDVYYAVEDGRIELLSSNDAINASDNGFSKVVQSSWVYPEKHLRAVLDKEDKNLRKMITGMGIKYGCIFFSGFVDQNEEFVFFECGFRLEGGHQYEYVSRKGPINFLDLFIWHALTGNTKGMERTPDKNPNLKCVTINFYAKSGVIAEIKGAEEISKMEDCSLAIISGRVGQKCDDNKAILSKIAMFSFCNESPDKIKEDLDEAYRVFSVKDESGNDMIYDRIDTSVIPQWWD